MATSAEDIAAALEAKSPSDPAPTPSTPSSKSINIRPADDYESATLPTFHVDYADSEPDAKVDKLRKNPLVPLGALGTAAILAGGLFSFRRGNAVWSQRMMQARIGAQGLTLAILAGSVYVAKAEDGVRERGE